MFMSQTNMNYESRIYKKHKFVKIPPYLAVHLTFVNICTQNNIVNSFNNLQISNDDVDFFNKNYKKGGTKRNEEAS